MTHLSPYLNFMGKTEEAFNFYKSVFGGEFVMLQRFSDTPMKDQMQETDLNKIMHVSLMIGDGVLMGTDALESAGHMLTFGNAVSLTVSVDTREEADRIFNGLLANGKSDMSMTDLFWGAYFGMVDDRFGIKWMISYDAKYADGHK